MLIFESFLRILVKFRKKLNDAGFPRLAGFQGLKNLFISYFNIWLSEFETSRLFKVSVNAFWQGFSQQTLKNE